MEYKGVYCNNPYCDGWACFNTNHCYEINMRNKGIYINSNDSPEIPEILHMDKVEKNNIKYPTQTEVDNFFMRIRDTNYRGKKVL